jgi:hypothetical protein
MRPSAKIRKLNISYLDRVEKKRLLDATQGILELLLHSRHKLQTLVAHGIVLNQGRAIITPMGGRGNSIKTLFFLY